jgi:hypothetical protein
MPTLTCLVKSLYPFEDDYCDLAPVNVTRSSICDGVAHDISAVFALTIFRMGLDRLTSIKPYRNNYRDERPLQYVLASPLDSNRLLSSHGNAHKLNADVAHSAVWPRPVLRILQTCPTPSRCNLLSTGFRAH